MNDDFVRELLQAVRNPARFNAPERIRVTAGAPRGEVWSLPYVKDDDDLDVEIEEAK